MNGKTPPLNVVSALFIAVVLIVSLCRPVFAQITLVTTGSGSSNNSVSVVLPTPAQVGDLLVAQFSYNATGATITTSTPWNTLRTDYAPSGCAPGSTCAIATKIYWRVAVAGEVNNYTFTIGGGGQRKASVGILLFRNADTADPFAAHAAQASVGTSDTVTAPALGSVQEGAFLLALFGVGGESTYTATPAGYTTQYTANLAKGGAGHPNLLGTSRGPLASAESPPAVTATASVSTFATLGHHLAIRRSAGFNHYEISAPAGTAFSTCNDIVVNIKGHTATHAVANPPAGTVMNITTSTGTGTWQAFSAASGDLGTSVNFVPSGTSNGQATYTWSGTESTLQVRIRPSSTASFNVNLSDGTRSEDALEDPTFSVGSSSVQVTGGVTVGFVPTQITAKPNNAGWNPSNLFLRAVPDSISAPSCDTEFQGRVVNVDLAIVCESPSACSGVLGTDFLVLNSASNWVPIARNNSPGPPASYTSVPLQFNSSALATLNFQYGDAGMTRLYMRLPASEGGATGSSDSFVTRPFGFAFRGANLSTPVQHGTTESASLFSAAGDNFTMTLGAYKWAPGQDADIDGIPDSGVDLIPNGVAPSFASTTTVSVVSNLPGVDAGNISRGALCSSPATIAGGEWLGGAATISDWCYSEAGNVQLGASSVDYLGVSDADITGSSGFDGTGASGGYVGRFRPKRFALDKTLAIPVLTNRVASSCSPASSFSYMGEDMGFAFRLIAQNTQGQTTKNYNGVYAKLDPSAASVYEFGARAGSTNLTPRLLASYAGLTPSWSSGVLNIVAPDQVLLRVNRATPDTPDGPYTGVVFGIAPSDTDGVTMGMFDFDADGNAINERVSLGVTTEVRFGRLRLGGVIGSPAQSLRVPFETQYWTGTFFARNALDSCTLVTTSNVALGNIIGGIATGVTNVSSLSGGRGTITLSPPNASGSVDVSTVLGPSAAICPVSAPQPPGSGDQPWLRGQWCGAANDRDPTVRARFGVRRGSNEVIFMREIF